MNRKVVKILWLFVVTVVAVVADEDPLENVLTIGSRVRRQTNCLKEPIAPIDSNLDCNIVKKKCVATCLPGYTFPDGETTLDIHCVDNQWSAPGKHADFFPSCEAVCNPPCLSNALCVAPNVCACPSCDYNECFQEPTAPENSVQTCSSSKCTVFCNRDYTFPDGTTQIDIFCRQGDWISARSDWPVVPNCLPGNGNENEIDDGGHNIVAHAKVYDICNICDIVDPKPPVDDTKKKNCITYGGSKIQNFDGLLFESPLYCSHVLLQDKANRLSVVVRACGPRERQPCPHALIVTLDGMQYTFENVDGTVTLKTPRHQFPIPAQFTGMRVTKVKGDVKIELTDLKTNIIWNTQKTVTIQAPETWSGKTQGLCGNMNGKKNDDFLSPEKVPQKSPDDFVDSWRVPKFDKDPKQCEKEKIPPMPKCEPNKLRQAESVCGTLLKSQKVAKCMSMYNIDALMRACISDFCNCYDSDPNTCACEAAEALADECKSKGVRLDQGWRDLKICPYPCPTGKIYDPCGPVKEPSCGDTEPPNRSQCVEGCVCATGTLNNFGKCVPKEQCMCEKDGRIFKPNSEYIVDCNTCVCRNGLWECGTKNCSEECHVHGDPHYKTFDGKKFDFMGKCSYYLLAMENLTIVGNNIACPTADPHNVEKVKNLPSCIDTITINYLVSNILFETWRKIELFAGKVVKVDGKKVNLPVYLDDTVGIRQTDKHVIVEFNDGLKVVRDAATGWTGRVKIEAPWSYRGRTMGLCGTMNNDQSDDMTTPDGKISNSVGQWCKKWQTNDSCPHTQFPPPTEHPCDANPIVKRKAEQLCAKLKGDGFKPCHSKIDVSKNYEDCLFDICATQGEDFEEFYCGILDAYADECANEGIFLDWHKHVRECTETCPPGQIFDPFGNCCARTCEDLQGWIPCKSSSVAGCRCPDGKVLNENNECVTMKECPCYSKGQNVPPGCVEIRPGTKTDPFDKICTCIGARWDCKWANDNELDHFPSGKGNCTIECNANNNEVLVPCMRSPPLTCYNYYDYPKVIQPKCIPGCECKPDFVRDPATNKCIRPQECKCRDGNVKKDKCNPCQCRNGAWKCQEKNCPGTCSAWGNSHISTFDEKDYDFLGLCSYIMAQGTNEKGSFAVIIDNTQCGSLGETCSKSIRIEVNLGNGPEVLVLSAGSPVPNGSPSKSFTIHKSGVYVVIEIPELGVKILWDQNTRVHVTVAEEWSGKVQGLCGDFNFDDEDDFKIKGSGTETTLPNFVDSWKIGKNCKSTRQGNSCENRPPWRRIWADQQCHILKTNVFEPCHKLVPVEGFFKRCIYDACACDLGGDCRCVCTALAEYAQACARKGVQLQWRRNDLCPMQCGPGEFYDPCITTCPDKNCGNLDWKPNVLLPCKEHFCVEGCRPKDCEPGFIRAENGIDCIPASSCKVLCTSINGVDFYEEDVFQPGPCVKCVCRKGQFCCAESPCTETSTEKSRWPWLG
ncbi:hypothetical protein DMENIID0001_013180 [Sergentomyia squamirostris]